MSPKTYVLDTNILIQAPHALLSFADNYVVLPIAVIEELDRMKSADGERGANARQVIRILDDLRKKGDLTKGIPLANGGNLRIEMNYSDIEMPGHWGSEKADNRILQVCKGLHDKKENTILVSNDIVVRIKGDILGIPAEDFTTDMAPVPDEQYSGRRHVYTDEASMANFRSDGIHPDHVYTTDEMGERMQVELEMNEFLIIHHELEPKTTHLGRFDGQRVVPLRSLSMRPFGVTARTVGQRFLQEALMADAKDAPLVIVKGPAGTAKTFYALATGLHQIMEEAEPRFRRILISRPNTQFDEEIGFLPGNEQEKIAPYLRPVIDNLEQLFDSGDLLKKRNEKELSDKIAELFDRGILVNEAMNYIRGRSITNTWIMIDEAQNLTPRQAKGLITRAGLGTKLILLGDPGQIDHPYLDARTNGLSYASEHMRGSPLCWQITMQNDECERSPLAKDAAKRM